MFSHRGYWHLHVGRRLGRIVQLTHQLVVCTGIADTDVANAASDVGLIHAVHLRIGDEVDRAIDVLKQRASCKLRRAHVIHRIELVFVERVSSKPLEHIGEKGDVAQQIKQHVRAHILNSKVFPHSLGASIIRFGALFTCQSTEELSSRLKLSLSKSLELVDVVIAEHSFLLDQL